MTEAESFIQALDEELAGYGQTVTLIHQSTDADGATTITDQVSCPAKVRPYTPQDLEAGEVRDIRVILSPTSLKIFGMPGRDTRIIIEDDDPSNIEQLEPLFYGGVLVRLNLLCRG